MSKNRTSTYYYHKNKPYYQAQQQLYYQGNREHILQRVSEYARTHQKQIKQYRKEHYKKFGKQEYREKQEYYSYVAETLFIFALDIVTHSQKHKCTRCGETDLRCLEFDHIRGGGRKHYTLIKSTRIVKWVIKHPKEARKKLQVLCGNCNWKKRYEDSGYVF